MRVLQILSLILGLTVFANAQTAILTGTVYDANGSVIVGAKITAITQIDGRLQKFEKKTDYDGVYYLYLPVSHYSSKETIDFKNAKYILLVEANGFGRVEYRGLNFMFPTKGKMNLDFTLSIQQPTDTIKVDSNKNKTKRKNNKQ